MPPAILTLLALTAAVLGLLLLLTFAIVRLRRGAIAGADPRGGRLSEEAFAAAAMQEAFAMRASSGRTTASGSSVDSSSLDAAALDVLPVGLVIADAAGILRRVNPAACRMLGLTPPATGYGFRETLAGHPEIHALLERAQRTRTTLPREQLRIRVEGTGQEPPREVDAVVDVNAIVAPAGELRGLVLTMTEVPQPAPVDDRVRQREIDAALGRLTPGFTHELANSLMTLHGYARLIDPGALSEPDRQALGAIVDASAAMSATLEAFRRVARPLELERDRIPLRTIVYEAVAFSTFDPGSADGITQDVPDSIEVNGDRVLLEEAFAHLIRNAIEACADAGLPVRVEVSARTESGQVIVDVRDRGPGVPEAERPKLFQPFHSTRADHTGIGLARARHIMAAHDGAVQVDFPPDGGLLVTVTLPLAESAPPVIASR